MKPIFALFLACATGAAGADPANPCGAPLGARKIPFVDIASAAAAFPCAPAPIGGGTVPTFRSNAAGTVAWWYCPSPGGEWILNFAAATAARMSASSLFDDAYTVITSPNPKAAFDAIAAKNVTLPLTDPSLTPIWCPYFDEMVRSTPSAPDKSKAKPREAPASSQASAK